MAALQTPPCPDAAADPADAAAHGPYVPALPSVPSLAALGPVLCLYRGRDGELAGWAQALRATAWCGIDSDGPNEALLFFDGRGECCWRLHLLPDSDFLMWERLCASLPIQIAAATPAGLAERLWQHVRACLRGHRWSASVLRLHALEVAVDVSARPTIALAASLVVPSGTGLAAARRIARAAGAEDDALRYDTLRYDGLRHPRRTTIPANGPGAGLALGSADAAPGGVDAVDSMIRMHSGRTA